MNKKPCQFLSDKGCSIYGFRPLSCREYPHTDKSNIGSRLINLIESCAVCPVLFEIFERLKEHYGNYFKSFINEVQE